MQARESLEEKLTSGQLREYASSFLASSYAGKVQTQATYGGALREFVRWFEQDGKCHFTTADIFRYRDHLVQEKRLSQASVSTYLAALRRFLEYLRFSGLLAHNPAKHVRGRVAGAALGNEALTSVEVDKLIATVDSRSRRGMRDMIILRLMVDYGISEIELTRTNVKDFVLAGGSGTLRLQSRGRITRVVLQQEMTDLLRDYLALRMASQMDQPLLLSDGNRTRGLRMTTRGIRGRISHYLEAAGIESRGTRNVSPHVLRNTAGYRMAAAGLTLDEIRYRMRLARLANAKVYLDQPTKAT